MSKDVAVSSCTSITAYDAIYAFFLVCEIAYVKTLIIKCINIVMVCNIIFGLTWKVNMILHGAVKKILHNSLSASLLLISSSSIRYATSCFYLSTCCT